VCAIDAAHAEIYLEIYIFAEDNTASEIKAALMRAAQRGVAVYVLVDWLGTGRKIIKQLARDFASAGVPVKLLLTRKYTFDELCETLQLAFRDKTAQQLFNVLYRIDVSEKQLFEGMPTPGIDDRLFAEIIIKRELQKVVLRKLYSSNNPINTEE
jgi:hypothetical protein